MKYQFIRFAEEQEEDMLWAFDESVLGKTHILIATNQDFTLCGHATDEYKIDIVKDKPTCKECIEFVKICKSIRTNRRN